MKNLIIIIVLIFTLNTYGQKIYNLDKKRDSISYTKTKDFAIYNGEKKHVYVSKNGKLFILVNSKKTGKEYKKYLNYKK